MSAGVGKKRACTTRTGPGWLAGHWITLAHGVTRIGVVKGSAGATPKLPPTGGNRTKKEVNRTKAGGNSQKAFLG